MAMTYAHEGASQVSPKPVPQLQSHADVLHDLATRQTVIGDRISAILSRVTGPTPPEQQTNNPKESDPTGVFHVAQFGAERIRRETARVSDLVSRLEEFF